MAKITPLMRQYWDIKSAHEDKILLFRMGDFFEMFFDDAETAAPILGIALTQRNKKAEDKTPMCGVPHHSIGGQINKLLAQGHKIAICDQVEDPKKAKGLVKRAVTRILTPGMVYDSESIDGTKPLYLACYDEDSISFLDGTTGEAFYFLKNDLEDQLRLIQVLSVAEVVLSTEQMKSAPQFAEHIVKSEHNQLAPAEDSRLPGEAPKTAARLLSYAQSLAGEEAISSLRPFQKRSGLERMSLSPTVLRHLEVFENNRGETRGALFSCINRCKTSVGARLLRSWLCFPLCNLDQVLARQSRVEYWVNAPNELKTLRQKLAEINDLERSLSRVTGLSCSPREVLSMAFSLKSTLEALALDSLSQLPKDHAARVAEMINKVVRSMVDEPPMNPRQGHIFQEGLFAKLDELIVLATQSQKLLRQMEQQEREQTGISSLKIRYNNVFGYYIEVTNTHKDKVPSHYQRKQTLTNAERYCTEELVELERKVITAQTKRNELEESLFEDLRKEVIDLSSIILHCAQTVAELDAVSALAWLAIERRYTKPAFDDDLGIQIKASRHPVVEVESSQSFIANDIILSAHHTLLLTGPNMAGKSTLMRQVAITALLAQIGSYVPAEQASLPLFDTIYTRIGASDFLTEGLSTFMVEMKETAEMISHVSDRSLVILDEIGRGTSTFDGLSLAQAILEHLLVHGRCLTFFATHYHELTGLTDHFSALQNGHMKVVEREGDIRFLYSLVPGPALKSYGIHVAKLAGLPRELTRRAQSLLKGLESQKLGATSQMSFLEWPDESEGESLSDHSFDEIIEEIKNFSTNESSPIEALNQIVQWQKNLS